MDTYHPPATYAQVFEEHSQPHPQPFVPHVQRDHVPSSTSTPSEWHWHGSTSEQPTSSAPDSTLQDTSVLFRFIFSQFSALQSKLESKFAVLENNVDTKLNQLQVRLERHITEYAYNHASKMYQMEKHLSEQLNTIRKDHFHSNKRFR